LPKQADIAIICIDWQEESFEPQEVLGDFITMLGKSAVISLAFRTAEIPNMSPLRPFGTTETAERIALGEFQ
jgi:hypothetical protein